MASGSHITVKGLDELSRKLKALPEVIEKAARLAIIAEVDEVMHDMIRDAPYDTGHLVRGIQAEYAKSGLVGRAVSTADYTKYVVHGTSTHPAQDFIEPAGMRARQRFPKRVEAEVKEQLRKIT